MKRLYTYIAFLCLTSFSATNALDVIAGGCTSRHMNKKTENICADNETECQSEKSLKFDLNDSSNS